MARSRLPFVSVVVASFAGPFAATHAGVLFLPRYAPKTIEIEHKLQPFIPDFIPAVGDIDAFLKVQSLQAPLRVLPRRAETARGVALAPRCGRKRSRDLGNDAQWFGRLSNGTCVIWGAGCLFPRPTPCAFQAALY